MTRIVVDSNVYISALVFGGVPQTALDIIQSQGHRLYISQPIMDEVAEVLAAKFDWTKDEIDRFLPPLWERCVIVSPAMALKISNDEDDNRVYECAAAAEAHFLVTGNTKHFKKHYKGTRVVTARQLLDVLVPGEDKYINQYEDS